MIRFQARILRMDLKGPGMVRRKYSPEDVANKRERENAQLKKLLAELGLDERMLWHVATENFMLAAVGRERGRQVRSRRADSATGRLS